MNACEGRLTALAIAAISLWVNSLSLIWCLEKVELISTALLGASWAAQPIVRRL
jgi:hypothetical protein